MTKHGRDNPLCFSKDTRTTWGQFAQDVDTLRPQIADASCICNVLGDRYDFMVGLAAAMLNGQRTILPNAVAPAAVTGALQDTDSPVVLGGKFEQRAFDWHIPAIENGVAALDPSDMLLQLKASTAPIDVFTSGTTKTPEPHVKNWSILSGGAAVTATILERLGFEFDQCALLGTTPHQHMYGLEATVFAGLAFGYSSYRAPLFFPSDLELAVQSARTMGIQALVLITSPAHLRFLEPTILANAEIRGIISATAPLPLIQAERLETRGDLAVMEIYGSTETGSLATRRTVEGDIWQPLVGFTLEPTDDGCLARAPHLPDAVPLGDIVEIKGNDGFALLDRKGDMVSINGKKTTLAALNAVLIETPGLADGVVLCRKHEGNDILTIVAVREDNPSLSEAEMKDLIRRQFLHHLDPVFVARQIVFSDHLPRSQTGKLPLVDLEDLLRMVGI